MDKSAISISKSTVKIDGLDTDKEYEFYIEAMTKLKGSDFLIW